MHGDSMSVNNAPFENSQSTEHSNMVPLRQANLSGEGVVAQNSEVEGGAALVIRPLYAGSVTRE